MVDPLVNYPEGFTDEDRAQLRAILVRLADEGDSFDANDLLSAYLAEAELLPPSDPRFPPGLPEGTLGVPLTRSGQIVQAGSVAAILDEHHEVVAGEVGPGRRVSSEAVGMERWSR